jgi:hypothetical protein
MAPPRRTRKRTSMWTFLFLVCPAALVMGSTTMIILAGMIPTMVAYVIDRDSSKPAAIAVGGFNFCGCLPFAILLWKGDHSFRQSFQILSQPLSWLLMFGAAAIGWAFYFGIPPLIAGAEVAKAERKIEALKKRKVSLVQEWGPDVAADPMDDEPPGLAEG